MKKQTKRWLAAVLSIMLFAISLYTDAGITANAAGTKATEVSIANLPEGNMLTLSEEKNYGQYDFDATKISGVLYWEVKKGTKTGVQSSYTGKVYPVTSGEFEIRVLAFRTRANRTKWLNARKANGYVADPKAETYVKAASDWVKITVKGEEGLAVAGTQSRLNKLLKDKNVKHIVVFTNAERDFVIGSKNYKSKILTVNAPNADVDNQGRFAAINVAQIKDSTFRERAKGNRFHVTAPNARIIVEKGARVGAVSFQPDMKKDPEAKLNLEVNGTLTDLTIAPLNHVKGEKQAVVAVNTTENANVSGVKVEEAAILEIKGENPSKTKVTVEEKAEGTVISAETPIAAELKASVELKLDKGASNSVLTLLKVITALISGGEESKAENVTVKVEKEAEGAKLETVAKVEVQTEVKVEITLNEGAEGSTIVADSEVAKEIKVENQTKEDVVIKDETGEVTTTVGAGSDVQVTPVPTTAPSTGTTTPGGSANPPSTSTPAPTAAPEIKVGKVTYTLDGKEEAKEITLRVNENPDVNENNKADAYYVGDITIPQGTRIVQFEVEAKEPYQKSMGKRYFGFNEETGVVSGIAKDVKTSYNLWTWTKFEEGAEPSHVEILVNISAGEDKVTPSGTPKPGELERVWYHDSAAGKEVEVEFKPTEKAFIYEAEISVPEGQSGFTVSAKGSAYGNVGTYFDPQRSENKIILYPLNPDVNTVLIVNLKAKKTQEPPTAVGELSTVSYTVGSGTTPKTLNTADFTLSGTTYTYKNTVTETIAADTDKVSFTVIAAGYKNGTASVGKDDTKATITMTPTDTTENTEFTVEIPVKITVTVKEDPKAEVGTLGTITYKVNGEGASATVTPSVTPDAEGKCTVTINIEKDNISTVSSLVFEIAAVENQYQAVTGAAVTEWTTSADSNSKTGTVTVTVSPVNEKLYKPLEVTFNVTVSKTGTAIPAYSGSVSYQVGENGTLTDAEMSTSTKTKAVNLAEGVVGSIAISLPGDADASKYKISTTFKKNNQTSDGKIAAGETVIATVVITANDTVKNSTTYTITFTAPDNTSEEDNLTVTIKANPTITVGSTAIVVTGSATTTSPSAIDSDANADNTSTATPSPADIIEVTLAPAESAATDTATATVKFKGDYTKDKFSAGKVKITFEAEAKKGTQTVTENITYTWKKANETLSDKTGAICEVEVDLTQLENELTFSVIVAENPSTTTP